MDLNPELLSAIDRLCVGLVVQCMFQCRVHNLNFGESYIQGAPLAQCALSATTPRPLEISLALENAVHAVRTQCEVLDVGKYSNPSFGPFSQVFGFVLGFFFHASYAFRMWHF